MIIRTTFMAAAAAVGTLTALWTWENCDAGRFPACYAELPQKIEGISRQALAQAMRRAFPETSEAALTSAESGNPTAAANGEETEMSGGTSPSAQPETTPKSTGLDPALTEAFRRKVEAVVNAPIGELLEPRNGEWQIAAVPSSPAIDELPGSPEPAPDEPRATGDLEGSVSALRSVLGATAPRDEGRRPDFANQPIIQSDVDLAAVQQTLQGFLGIGDGR